MAGAQLREVQVRPGLGMAGCRHPHDNGRNLLSFFCLLSLILASSSAWQLGARRPGEEGPPPLGHDHLCDPRQGLRGGLCRRCHSPEAVATCDSHTQGQGLKAAHRAQLCQLQVTVTDLRRATTSPGLCLVPGSPNFSSQFPPPGPPVSSAWGKQHSSPDKQSASKPLSGTHPKGPSRGP